MPLPALDLRLIGGKPQRGLQIGHRPTFISKQN
jgi:hypothetical protein